MVVKLATNEMQGFDVNQVLSVEQAAAFKANGYDFCLRYIPRQLDNFRYNLTNAEMGRILQAGLSLMCVQHVSNDNWEPTGDLGQKYGEYAAIYCAKTVQLPKGVSVWLDLEMVRPGTPIADTISYANEWYKAVADAGYLPCLYVGYQCGLTPDELYSKLPFKSYWKAYNYDDGVSVRSFCMSQHPQTRLNGITFDPNTIQADNLGGLPMLLSPN